ncbi:UNVERIFIED_CONTAM: hypothetical protein FKN15_063242 [Acipenser sinensis]
MKNRLNFKKCFKCYSIFIFSVQTELKTTTKNEVTKESARSRKRKADVAIYLQDPDEEVAAMTKKKQYEIQTCWSSATGCTSPCRLIPTPDKEIDEPVMNTGSCMQYRFKNIFVTPVRSSPLPVLGVQTELKTTTKNEVTKESARSRKRKADVAIYLQDPDEEVAEMTKKKQYEIQTCWSSATGCTSPCRLIPTPDKEIDEPVMNTGSCMQYRFKNIFVTPVCEVYKLHRETFYLAQDFFDRFMATQTDVVKTRLQLIGIASLFVAAKLEEIYPPKLYQFAYVTDGACTEDEILDMELIVMKELKWSLSPLTTLSWLNIYMQVAYLKENTETSKLLIPHYPQATFVQIAELMDLCVLDVGCLEYAYGVLAASALFHFSSLELVQKVSGFEWRDIEECVRWMVPFAMSIREVGSSGLKKFKGISPEDTHNIQTHSVHLEWLFHGNRFHTISMSFCFVTSTCHMTVGNEQRYENVF